MAGFAILMQFLFCGVILLLVASVASVMLSIYANRVNAGDSHNARKYRRELIAAPFAAILWVVLSLVAYTWVSNHIAHQSVSFSPDPYITLTNGYVVGSSNTYDGYVHAPGMNTDIPWAGPGYVRGLIDLKYADGHFHGTYLDSRSEMQPQGTNHIRGFTFNTQDRSISTSDSSIAADFGQQQTMVHEDSNSYWQFYAANRHQWPESFFWLFLLTGEAIIVWYCVRIKPVPSPDNES